MGTLMILSAAVENRSEQIAFITEFAAPSALIYTCDSGADVVVVDPTDTGLPGLSQALLSGPPHTLPIEFLSRFATSVSTG
jgi:hypothetical protein